MIRFNDWGIDADNRCYTIGRPKTRITKKGDIEEYLADAKYFSTLAAALNGIVEAERKNIVHSRDMTLQEAIEIIRKNDERMCELFRDALNKKESRDD